VHRLIIGKDSIRNSTVNGRHSGATFSAIVLSSSTACSSLNHSPLFRATPNGGFANRLSYHGLSQYSIVIRPPVSQQPIPAGARQSARLDTTVASRGTGGPLAQASGALCRGRCTWLPGTPAACLLIITSSTVLVA